jgi:hypothetical protein
MVNTPTPQHCDMRARITTGTYAAQQTSQWTIGLPTSSHALHSNSSRAANTHLNHPTHKQTVLGFPFESANLFSPSQKSCLSLQGKACTPALKMALA